ncbi:MAG TPA: hypothetical protein VFZ09_22200 [Archangium sp.]|uniref:hypothetical protein n=1 Tax=Archangium sp. TaxID=1872627 RepID=UPI002E2F0ECA|nr:hypothetical protein [Archangium sp.]HEX5748969.1 hypothetical protein [Archangium sp.]
MRSSRTLVCLLSCLALSLGTVGCPSQEPSPPDAGTDAGVPPGVTGQRAVLTLTQSGEVRRPVDLSASAPRALVFEGGTFVTHEGVGRADGTFTIPNVPAGTYYLGVDPTTFVVTDAREVDLTSGALGRPDVALLPMGAGSAAVAFELGNLHPYQSTDGITLFSANANVARFRLTPTATAGATSGTFTYTVRTGQPLIDPARGDRALLTQLTTRTTTLEGGGETVTYRSVSRSFEAPEFQTRPGEAQTISGTMSEPPALTAPIHWDLAAYRNLASAVNPRATVLSQIMVFDVLPTPLDYGAISAVPQLVEFIQPPTAGDMRADFVYANPYPSSWNPIGVTESRFQVPYQLPGTTTPAVLSGSVSYRDTLSTFLSRTIAPPFGPVRQPLIEGMDARQPVTLTTTTPELSWTAPSTEQDVSYNYIVFIHQLTVQSPATVSRFVGSLRTKDTRVRLPPGLLSPGNAYVFIFDVNTTPGSGLLRQVFRVPVPITGAQALSEIVTVP